ncbi:MAG: right-handed parallel beta-helix repeat-containing protein, partial [Chitinophagales bacterium]|nr:right-handed parallel beta-helix repeat-containing protein [Chitinophagales bacterium]
YDSADATQALVNAIHSSADTIIVDKQAAPWHTGSMHFYNLMYKTILFENGVQVVALPGMFSNPNANLFRFQHCTNITLIGYGAVLKMNKSEYALLNDSEYRHSINLISSSGIVIKGLTLLESGGDGICIDGNGTAYCENILIEDVRCLNHYRQGLSVLNVKNLTVRNSEFSGTSGTLPEAGIDIEPYQTTQQITNLFVENCRLENNGWAGIAVNLFELDSTSLPVSIVIRNCVFRNNASPANAYVQCEIYASDNYKSPVKGSVLIDRCYIEESNYGAFYSRKVASSYSLTFRNCVFQNVSKLQIPYNKPIFLEVANYYQPSPELGGIHFDNVTIQYQNDFSFLRVFGAPTLAGVKDLTGHISVMEPNNNGWLFTNAGTLTNVSLTYTTYSVIPPTQTFVEKILGTATECPAKPAIVSINRSAGQTSFPVGISYTTDGTATLGDDFPLLPGGLVIPADSSSVPLVLAARNDAIPESDEAINLILQPAPLYGLAEDSAATLVIQDCLESSMENGLVQGRGGLYPNPACDFLFIQWPGTPQPNHALVSDIVGRKKIMVFLTEQEALVRIDLSGLPSGVYLLTSDEANFSRLFVKR